MTNYSTESEAESYEAAHLARIALDAAMEAVDHYQRRHGVCDAPFRCTLHVDNGDEADREGTFPPITTKEEAREAGRDALRRAGEAHDRYTGRDGWIRHDGGECPVHPMDVVEMIQVDESPLPNKYGVPAASYGWVPIKRYRPLRDEDGVPYCSAEGLEDWAEYVATDGDGSANQSEKMFRPFAGTEMWWPHPNDKFERAPKNFANTRDHWTETLRRVYRREDA